MVNQVTAVSLPEAFEKKLIIERKRLPEIEHIIQEEPKATILSLRYPEKDAKTERDFMRISFKEEDEQFIKE